MFYGYLNLPFVGYIAYTLIVTHITIAAVTIFLHRCQAHRALTLHPIISHFFRFWLWITTGMETKAWAAIHRKHHAKCETEEDPHSPQIFGLKKVLLEGVELYRKEAQNKETLDRYGAGTPDDWIERKLYTKYSSKGIFLMLAVNLFLLGVPGLTVWAIQMMWIPFFAAGIINGVGHFIGYRNFDCSDASTNISPFGILIGGEELHNNHHTYPTSAKLSVKWWEFDIGWFYIKTLSIFGLAKPKRTAPKVKVLAEKNSVDADTLRDLISNRFQVMTNYTNKVLMPIFNQETNSADKESIGIFKEAKKFLKNSSISNKYDFGKLKIILNNKKHEKFATVFSLREQLQDIWDKTAASQKELIESLQEWCKKAESSRIETLKEFSSYLKSYSLATA